MTALLEESPARLDWTQSAELVVDLAAALHAAGAPAHRLEATVDAVSRSLGVRAAVFAQPTSVYLDLDGKTRMLRVEPRDVALADLVEIDRLARRVESGETLPAQARLELAERMAHPKTWSKVTTAAASAGTAGAAAVFFGGGALELVLSAALSAAVGFAPARLSALMPLTAAIGVGLIARLASTQLPIRADIVLLAGLIVLLPGFTLTTGLTELATRHLSSGTARLSAAAVTLLQLGVGIGLASAIAGRLGLQSLPVAALASPEPWTQALALTVAALSFLVLFRARARDLPAILGVAFLAVHATRLGGELLGAQSAPFLGALAVGLAANVHARLRDVPALVLLVPGLILLVPGSLGFSGVRALVSDGGGDLLDGARMLLVGASLATGLLAANALLPPRRAL